jgi:hypothetical protein
MAPGFGKLGACMCDAHASAPPTRDGRQDTL